MTTAADGLNGKLLFKRKLIYTSLQNYFSLDIKSTGGLLYRFR